MPIEFRCTQCGRLLRTPDDTAGKQAQCPACGTLSTIPPSAEFPQATPPLSPLAAAASVSPGPAPDRVMDAGPEAAAAAGAEKPYQAPGSTAYVVPPAQRVSGPAIALIVVGSLGVAGNALGALINLMHMALGPRLLRVPNEFHALFGGGFGAAMNLVGLAIGLFILIGAIKMKNLESHSVAVASAIVAMIPCFSPCCLLGLPLGFGRWSCSMTLRSGRRFEAEMATAGKPAG